MNVKDIVPLITGVIIIYINDYYKKVHTFYLCDKGDLITSSFANREVSGIEFRVEECTPCCELMLCEE